MLYQVATGLLSSDEIAAPIRSILRRVREGLSDLSQKQIVFALAPLVEEFCYASAVNGSMAASNAQDMFSCFVESPNPFYGCLKSCGSAGAKYLWMIDYNYAPIPLTD